MDNETIQTYDPQTADAGKDDTEKQFFRCWAWLRVMHSHCTASAVVIITRFGFILILWFYYFIQINRSLITTKDQQAEASVAPKELTSITSNNGHLFPISSNDQ